MEGLLKLGERIDDLQVNNLKIIQDPNGFCFGLDAVLLANFVEARKGSKIVDLGTGTGIIPILLAGKTTDTHIKAVEIQSDVAEMASRSVILNQMEQRIEVLNIDLKESKKYLPTHQFDVVTSNPPYMHSEGLLNLEDKKAISRHEIKCTLEDVIETASRLLNFGGKFYMVHRPQRLVDIMILCRKYKLEPKRLRFVHSKNGKKPNLLLLECKKNSQPELKIIDPLVIYKEDGSYTDEIYQIYGKTILEEGGGNNGKG